jgi:hypothetical protein
MVIDLPWLPSSDLLLLLALLAIAALFFLKAFELLPTPTWRRRRHAFSPWQGQKNVIERPMPARDEPRIGDSVNQLRHVMSATFYKKKVMSKAEYRVFKTVEAEISALRKGYRVLSQTSLGEIIGSDDKRAFQSINSKRVDILVMGPYGEPVAAIEYQGGEHHQGMAAARDAVKREALRRAGVHFIEVLEDHSQAEIAQLVRRVL